MVASVASINPGGGAWTNVETTLPFDSSSDLVVNLEPNANAF